jgi:signal transduction histidine kinase
VSIARAAASVFAPFKSLATRMYGGRLDMRLHRGHRLTLAFVPLLLTILVSGLLAMRGFRDLLDDERFVARANVVASQITTLKEALDNAEIDTRSYLLIGDARDLVAFTSARGTIDTTVVRLRASTAYDATLRNGTTNLAPLILKRLAVLLQADQLRAQQHPAAAVAVMRSAAGTQTMASLHTLLAEMLATENQRVDARLDAASGRFFEGQGPLVAATTMNVLLLIGLFSLIWYAFIARERHLFREREARAAAEVAITLRDQFLSVASHELRTPVTVLLPTLELVERRLSPTIHADERLRRGFATLHRQLARLQALIGAMLDVSRLQRGQLSIAHDPVDLAGLVRTVVDEVRPLAESHTIELGIPEGAIFVRGDAVRLSQVLLNLLQNAIKYSPDGGPIRVGVARTAGEVAVSVSDQGIGIPADAVAHLFERFYRAPPVRSEHISGMGIGLYVVGEVVALHGGKVTVSSVEGVGSTFTIRLPSLVAEGSAPDATTGTAAADGKANDQR